MSASSKKKLRKEESVSTLSEKQRQAKKEAKKLKLVTTAFVLLMVAVFITTATILIIRGVDHSGVLQKNTVAAVIDGEEISTVKMNYYFHDYVQNIYSNWSEMYGENLALYAGFMGLNINTPLDEQVLDQATGETWADYILKESLNQAKHDLVLSKKAKAENFTLTEEQQQAVDSTISTMELYASFGGYKNLNKYLQAVYGYGSTEETYREYLETSTLASAYSEAYNLGLTYDDAAIRAHEEGREEEYNSYNYATYKVTVSSFLKDGTEGEDGNMVYTDAQQEAALKEAEEVAKKLCESVDLEALDKAIAELEINAEAETAPTSTVNSKVMYASLPTNMKSWLSESGRVENEMTYVAEESTTTDADGHETTSVVAYTVVVFQSVNDNTRPLANVRHLLVAFEGGSTGLNGETIYSDSEKATAKAEAERLLELWKSGEMTEDSFAALVKEHTDDEGSKETGGLYEDIHAKSQYVTNFLNWAIDDSRKAGDTGIVVTEYGYHIMYYVSDDETTYRDYMITEELRSADYETWYNGIMDPIVATLGKTKYVNTAIIMAYLGS